MRTADLGTALFSAPGAYVVSKARALSFSASTLIAALGAPAFSIFLSCARAAFAANPPSTNATAVNDAVKLLCMVISPLSAKDGGSDILGAAQGARAPLVAS